MATKQSSKGKAKLDLLTIASLSDIASTSTQKVKEELKWTSSRYAIFNPRLFRGKEIS